MFRKLAGLAIVASLFFAGAAFAQTGNMAGTGHDFGDGVGFEGDSWNLTQNDARTCNVCHTTHSGDMSLAGVPLWDHELTTFASFQVYVGVNMNQTPGQPTGATQLCLGCHDGTIGLDSFGDNGRTSGTEMDPLNPAYVGTDLRDDHPVSVLYNGGTAGLQTGGPTATETQLFGGNVECASCHEPHNSANQPALLVMNPANSALCNSCHDK
jgi:predicted CXXCH cytochrome family protein